MAKGISTETIKPVKPPKVPKVPNAKLPQKSATGSHGRLPIATSVFTPPPPKPPDASWWRAQYAADPEYLMTDPALRAQQNQIAQGTGFVIGRDASGSTLYKTATGVTGITQQTGPNGEIVYKDATGRVYDPASLTMDIRMINPGETGYLSGQLGLASASSARQQQDIGEAAARSGVEKSGMRAATSIGESQSLQNQLRNITGTAMSGLSGVDRQYAQMISNIYSRLAPTASALAEAAKPTTKIPKPTSIARGGVLAKPTMMRIGKNRVVFPKGLDMSKVDRVLIGSDIAAAISKAGGLKKLKAGSRVAAFSAGGRRYRIVYVKGRFVVRSVG